MRVIQGPVTLKELLKGHGNIQAILWDMDGTIMQTEMLHAKVTAEVVNTLGEFNKTAQELYHIVEGRTDEQIHQILSPMGLVPSLSESAFVNKKNELFLKTYHQSEHHEIFDPAIHDILKAAKENNIIQAVVTSSERAITDALLSFLKLEHFFEFTITANDVTKRKPDPMPYEIAIERLGVEKHEVLILEDSETGIKAAKASGAHFVNVKWYENFHLK